ncbi:hypothetical protein TDB9533_01219 [Thalassocella blandensis]|nr:hypothetical protein TDB9533_01219 [Thalassocella blandensis]
MIEVLPKIAEVKLLRELSKVVILPMLIAAYLVQSNISIYGISINEQASVGAQTFQFLLVFLLSVGTIGFIGLVLHGVLINIHLYTNLTALFVLSVVFLTFGFLGVFGKSLPFLEVLESAWYYTSFVCGFYLLSMASDLERKLG